MLLKIRAENPDHGVIFGDGIEAHGMLVDWGREVVIAAAADTLSPVG